MATDEDQMQRALRADVGRPRGAAGDQVLVFGSEYGVADLHAAKSRWRLQRLLI
ncbi:MAG: hypothetical protein WKF73_02345 [Nocardioidaceae bacterium]